MQIERRGRRARLAACVTAALMGVVASTAGAQATTSRDTLTPPDTGRLEGVLVRAVRGGTLALPIAQRTIERATIVRRHFAQDVPLLLQGATPSLTAHTETGTPWGYSYLRLRGMDQTRVNITLDGVPMNDPEDQVLYFANFADLMSSVQSVQVQRGVGTSSAGTASFAGSINLETLPVAGSPRGGDLELQAGAFDSRRLSAAFRTGLDARGLAAYGRAGIVRTDGYRRHSGVDGRSLLLGGAWVGGRDLLKVTLLAGRLADTLSYVGATAEELAQDRRFNPLAPDERDRFTQQLVAVTHTRALTPVTTLATTIYRHSAEGSYDYFALPDRYRYNLQHWWYGMTSAVTTRRGGLEVHAGVNANTYERAHRAYLEPATQFHDNTGHKDDASAFVKATWEAAGWRWFADGQARWARFHYEPDVAAGITARSRAWAFFNPRVGVTRRLGGALSAFASVGTTRREPARNDLLAGDDDLNAGNVADYGDFGRVRPESVVDLEAGVAWSRASADLTVNGYAMEFRNDIARIGAPTASGAVLRRNVGASYRRGIEVDGRWRPDPRLHVSGNATWSRNRIRAFTDSSSGVPDVRRDVHPLLSPSLLMNQQVEWRPSGALALEWEGRYQGRAWLDNTNRPERRLPATYIHDVAVRVVRGGSSVVLRMANVGDHPGFGSGAVSASGTVRYFVLPPRAWYLTLSRTW